MRSPKADWSSFTEHDGYRKGGGSQGILGLGFYQQELLSRDCAPWKVISRKGLPALGQDQEWEHINRWTEMSVCDLILCTP